MTGVHYNGKIAYEIRVVPGFYNMGKDFLDALDKSEKYCNRHFPTWKQVNLI